MQYTSKVLPFAAALAAAVSLLAGGFLLQVGNPSANPEAKAHHAVLVIRGYACTNPEEVTVTATAEGIIDGKRQTIPLKLITLSGQGTYAVTRQWPEQGEWVVTLVGSNPKYHWQPASIVHVAGDTADFSSVRQLSHPPTAMEVEAALHVSSPAPVVASR